MQSIKLVFGTVWCYVANVSWELSAAAKKVFSQMQIKDNDTKILILAVIPSFERKQKGSGFSCVCS